MSPWLARLVGVPSEDAGHRFESPGEPGEVAALAGGWFAARLE